MYNRLIVSVGLALWLMLGAVGAQQQSAGISIVQVLQSRKADPEVQDQINQAFNAFEYLLAVSKEAAAPNSHWQVRLDSWRNAKEVWAKASATLADSVPDLERYALPLGTARGLIEQSDDLFLKAQDSSDPVRAVELLQQHEELRKQAEGLLRQVEGGCRAARNAYLRDGGSLLSANSLTFEQERRVPPLKKGGNEQTRSVEQACRVLREVADLNRQAFHSPDIIDSAAWRDAEGKLDALFDYGDGSQFHRELKNNCHCPIRTARERIEKLRGMQVRRLNPRAKDKRSLNNQDLEIKKEKQHIETEIRRTEECYERVCGSRPVILRLWINAFIPRTIKAMNIFGRTYPNGPGGATFLLGPEPDKQVGYLTDQRGFSNDPKASSRFHAEAWIEIPAKGAPRLAKQQSWCSPTVAFNRVSNNILCKKSEGTEGIEFRQIRQTGSALTLAFRAEAGNPCVDLFGTGLNPAPPFAVDLTIHIYPTQWVRVEGRITQFPAFEAYLSVNDRPAQPIFQKEPVSGKSPWDLFRGPTERLRASVMWLR